MIHTVILGSDTPEAGELIRILAMHPDVVIECAQARGREGIPLTSLHHGLIGETDLSFSALPVTKRCDVLFDFSTTGEPALVRLLADQFPDMRVVRLNRCATSPDEADNWVYAIPEINRKALVRGASRALIPSAFASMALVALFPLAYNLLLKDCIEIHYEAPADIIAMHDPAAVEKEIAEALRDVQISFTGSVRISTQVSSTRRAAILSLSIQTGVDLEHLCGMYDIYDDHHFAFQVTGDVGASEVAGTQKCVVALEKPDPETLNVHAVADCRMRGGAGEAVHIMNLLCGLHERTGLALKAIDFHPI